MTEVRASNTFTGRGGIWVVVQSILMLAVILLGVLFHGDWTQTPVIVLGVGLFVVGGSFGIAGVAVLGKNRTPFPEPREGSELIQHGIYARVRHPLYTSVMLASLGWALIWQSRASFAAALTLLPFIYAKARQEERWLRNKFPGYADYARRVPRFLPRLGQKANLVCNF
jgi:protein-S-isoprenylcysteine O-methyltransferase Ste14